MCKLSFGDAILVTDWKTVPATFHTVYIIFIEIPDEAQIDVELYTLPNFLNQLLFNLTLVIEQVFLNAFFFLFLFVFFEEIEHAKVKLHN